MAKKQKKKSKAKVPKTFDVGLRISTAIVGKDLVISITIPEVPTWYDPAKPGEKLYERIVKRLAKERVMVSNLETHIAKTLEMIVRLAEKQGVLA